MARQWWAENRHRLPPTRTHRTRSGGLHLLFEHASKLRNSMFCDYTNLPPLDILDHPTKDDAEASLKAIREVFVESHFADRKCDRENPEATNLQQAYPVAVDAFASSQALNLHSAHC